MAYNPNNPNGQATKANSAPVVLASDAGVTLAGAITATLSGPVTLAGSVVVSGTPTVNASIQGTVPVSGTFFQATQPVSGSVTASLLAPVTVTLSGGVSLVGTPTANVSIQGTVPVSGSFAIAAGSTVAAQQLGAPWSVTPATGSTLTAYQGNSPWGVNASIIGTPGVNASIQGSPTVVLGAGSTLTAYQGNSPWGVNASIQGTVPISGSFSIAAGSTVAAQQLGAPWSVTQGAGSTLTAYQGNSPWGVNASIQGTVPVSGSFAIAAGSTVAAQQLGAPWSVVQGAGSTLTAYQGNSPWGVNASIQGTAAISGNVSLTGGVSLVGTPTVNASIQGTVPVSGTFFQSTQPVSGNVAVSLLAPATVTLTGGVSLVGTPTVNASIQGIPAVSQSGAWAVNVSLLGNATLTAFQGGAWNVGASTVYAQMANASVAWTNANATNSTLALASINGYGTLFASFTGSSITGGTLNFEAYDGTTWWPLPMLRSGTYTLDTTYALNAAAAQFWQADVAGFQQARIRLNPAITGASLGTANLQLIANAAPNMVNMVVGQPTAANLQTTTTLSGGVAQLGSWAVNATQAGTWTVGAHNVSIAGNITLAPITATLSGAITLAGAITANALNVSLPGITAVNVSLLAPATVTLSGGAIAMVSADTRAAGTSVYYNPTLTNTKVAVKASAANLYGYHVYNPNSTIAYLQLFNAASSSVTIGLTTPTQVLSIPALGWLDDAPATPMGYGTALTVAMSAGPAANLTLATLNVLTNLYYI